jgi:signal transduction protein with GAF and PtsI domain
VGIGNAPKIPIFGAAKDYLPNHLYVGMRRLLGIICCAILITASATAQESLISDIMNVDAVNAASTEDFQKAEEEYTKAQEKEKAKLDKDLEKLNTTYQKDVEKVIKSFQKVLEGGVEKEVNNEKGIVQTQVNSLTIGLRRDKKLAANAYGVEMAKVIRELPKKLMMDKEKEINQEKEDMFAQFEQEFHSNQKSIKDFVSKQHVVESTE